MNFDLTVTIPTILAISAIISPILVAIINNHYNLKLKKIEMANTYKIKTFEEYVAKLQQFIGHRSTSTKVEYGNAYGSALLYASPSTRNIMISINRDIENSNFEEANGKLNNLCIRLQKDTGIKI